MADTKSDDPKVPQSSKTRIQPIGIYIAIGIAIGAGVGVSLGNTALV
jgi:hypothetical protein